MEWPSKFPTSHDAMLRSGCGSFGGYFLAAFAINHLGVRLFGLKNDILLAQQLAGYTLVVTF